MGSEVKVRYNALFSLSTRPKRRDFQYLVAMVTQIRKPRRYDAARSASGLNTRKGSLSALDAGPGEGGAAAPAPMVGEDGCRHATSLAH